MHSHPLSSLEWTPMHWTRSSNKIKQLPLEAHGCLQLQEDLDVQLSHTILLHNKNSYWLWNIPQTWWIHVSLKKDKLGHCVEIFVIMKYIQLNQIKQIHTKSKALRVASSVVTLPNIVVNPKISTSGAWNAMKIAMLSSVSKLKTCLYK